MASQTIILITGANSGVGFAAAKAIASASPDYHVLVGSRNPENGKKAVSELQAQASIKGTLNDIQIDVNDQASIDAAAKIIEDKFGRLDVLINNAGIAVKDGDLKTQIERTFQTNVTGPFVVTQTLTPLLLKSKNPYSIYVTSGLGSLSMAADPNNPIYHARYDVYRASKAALNMLVIQESKELGKQGVKTFAVCPGLVRSNLRGKTEEDVNAGGAAGDPDVAGQTLLSLIEGKRDADVGKMVHKDGVYPW
jgi:NAD(P)-dependent dehydrogenase (short-subunit alcohol dehydrogenase family)